MTVNTFLRSAFMLFVLTTFMFSQPAQQTTEQNPARQRYLQCLRLMGGKQYARAISELQQLITDHPDFTPAYRKLADAYTISNQPAEGEHYFQHLKRQNPQNPYPYYGLARMALQRKDFTRAIEQLKKSISLDPDYADAYGSNGGLTAIYQTMKDLKSGKQFFQALITKNPDNAFGYYGLGRLYSFENNWQQAIPLLKKSIAIKPQQLLSYQTLQQIYEMRGEFQLALQNSQAYLQMAKRQKDIEGVARALNRLAGMEFILGDIRSALSHLLESLRYARTTGAVKSEGMALNNVGTVYATLGNYPDALKYFQQGLKIVQKIGPLRTEIRTLYNIGLIYKDTGKYEQAFEYFQRGLRRAKQEAFRYERGNIHTGMAEAYQAMDSLRLAKVHFEKALKIARALQDEGNLGYNLVKLARLEYKTGEYKRAIDKYRQALALGQAIQDVQITWEANAGLGSCYDKLNRWQEAIQHYQAAIASYDSIRQNLDIETLTSSFLEDKYEVYPAIIHLFARQHQYDKAFQYAEKYKAKTLLEILSRGKFLFTDMLPDSLRHTLMDIQIKLQDAHSELSREMEQSQKDPDKILSLNQQITSLELKKAAFIRDMKKNHPAYYQLTSSEPLSVAELRQSVLRPGQLLIEYVVGPQRISLFAIGRDTLLYHTIPLSRKELANHLSKFSSIFRVDKSGETAAVLNPDLADFSIPPAAKLYQYLLKSVEPLLRQSRDIILVPDDLLNYLPFEALITDTGNVETRYDFANATFLVESATISYASSASLLAPGLYGEHHPSKTLLALGNPDFNLSAGAMIAQTRNQNRLLPLPHTEREVKRIGSMFSGSQVNVYTHEKATETILKQKAEQYRILHIASHFLVNDEAPLYSKLVLSQKGEKGDDGFLQTYEVFGMHLNADMVVLSACNTALGKLRKGEGLIGMTRAFLYAGVPSMVVSLWSVDDEATGEIMGSFYRYLQKGLPKNEALRRAKVDFLKAGDAAKSDPFYWAPFILIGNPQPLSLPGGMHIAPLPGILLLVMAGLLFIVLLRRKRRQAEVDVAVE